MHNIEKWPNLLSKSCEHRKVFKVAMFRDILKIEKIQPL